ncbi:hypothetical protein BGZ94_002400 [Podila epigama]|nr:hypothetical protein BGZ94_002400 [Podila epigama]
MATVIASATLDDEQTSNTTPRPLLVVPDVTNDSTTLLKHSPTDDVNIFKHTLESTPLNKKNPNVVTVLINEEDISKSAIIRDTHSSQTNDDNNAQLNESVDHDEDVEQDNDSCGANVLDDEYIVEKLHHLKTGFKRCESVLEPEETIDPIALSKVQELNLIHKPHTENFHMLVEQLQQMRRAAAAVHFEDAAYLDSIVAKCERVYSSHKAFGETLETGPKSEEVIHALYKLVVVSAKDTSALVQDWALVYHVLLDLSQRILYHASGHKSPSLPRMALFKKDSTSSHAAHSGHGNAVTPEMLQAQREVAANWSAQMRTFEQLANAFHQFAAQTSLFSLFHETETISNFYMSHIDPTYNKAQTQFAEAKLLGHLNAQINYTNLNKTLPKENALTTAEERKAIAIGPLFNRNHLGARRLLYEGTLTEFVAPTYGASKKKAAAMVVPKEYRLIVTTDLIYLCQDMSSCAPSSTSSSSRKKGANYQKPLRLVHEPVSVNDTQISSTPDMTEIQRYMVMLCFYNQTSYILQARTAKERDAWVSLARELRIEQPKPSDACREQDEYETMRRSASSTTLNGDGFSKSKGSLFKRLKSLRRSSAHLPGEDGHAPEIHPDQATFNEEDEHARRMQLGQPSLWEVRRLPTDLGVIPPLEHPIPFRRDHLYDTHVKIVDLTTGKVAPGEFGMGIEDRAAYHRDGCALFAVLRPPRLVKPEDVDKNREDYFLVGKRTVNGRDYCAEPPYITDFYARSWLHPNMHIEFDEEGSAVVIASMYRILCSSSKMVRLFEAYYRYLMTEAKISPDNTFLGMEYRSYLLRVSKKSAKTDHQGASNTNGSISGSNGSQRAYNDMGECNIEFRRMSNAEDAISVGFWNPATKRDMSVGVLMVKSSAIRTTSALGLNSVLNYSVHKVLQRTSPTELTFTLLQTDVQTTPGFKKGQRVIRKTEGSTSLDVYRVEGTRESLNELEDFIRVRIGTDCKAREYRETLALARTAFQESVQASEDDDDEEDKESDRNHQWSNGREIEPADDAALFAEHRINGYLETLHEVPEEEEDKDADEHEVDEPKIGTDKDDEDEPEEEDDDLSSSTATFRPKTQSALALMEKEQKEESEKQTELENALQSGYLQLDSSSFSDLASDGALSSFLDGSESPTRETEAVAAPSVADLTKFWAKTTSAAVLARSPSTSSVITKGTTPNTAVVTESAEDTAPVTTDVPTNASITSVSSVAETNIVAATAVTTTAKATTVSNTVCSELEARVSTVLGKVSTSNIVLQATESYVAQTNASGVIQPTRYLPKHRGGQSQNGEGDQNDIQPGVDMEQLRPVADLKKRWEEMHRMGI